MEQNSENAVHAILESHFISPTALSILLRTSLSRDDYEAFITERHRTLLEAIENLLIKQRLYLTPQLRELDQRVEGIELELRKEIGSALAADVARLPQHINQKIEERVLAATKKNAAIPQEQFKTLSGRLEFCDLRELQDTILNKALWPQFDMRFANKETLAGKFSQLAELRNGIRHSRSVDEITRMEGEAAILWFEHVLAR